MANKYYVRVTVVQIAANGNEDEELEVFTIDYANLVERKKLIKVMHETIKYKDRYLEVQRIDNPSAKPQA